MIWFTSDTHFGHENVLKFTDRPWETIWQMNDAIVDSINGRVAVDDELYILGDFSFKMTAQDAYALRKRIACRRIHLIPGNHDKDWTQPAVAGAFTTDRNEKEKKFTDLADKHDLDKRYAKNCRGSFLNCVLLGVSAG